MSPEVKNKVKYYGERILIGIGAVVLVGFMAIALASEIMKYMG